MNSTRDIIIKTEHLESAKDFYGNVLGFSPIKMDVPMLGFETGALRLFVESGVPSGPVFEFEVNDIDEAKARLLQNGCTVVEENPSVPRVYIRDPYGLVFNITQMT
jgi:predicted enzyme related to lactoylglutathione lyase